MTGMSEPAPTPPQQQQVRSEAEPSPVYAVPFSVVSQVQAIRYNPLTGKTEQGIWVRFDAPSISYSGEAFVPLTQYPQDARKIVGSMVDAAASVHG